MEEHKETGKVKLVSLTALVVALCCQILHKQHGEEKSNSEVDNSAALWRLEGSSSQAEWSIKDINTSLNNKMLTSWLVRPGVCGEWEDCQGRKDWERFLKEKIPFTFMKQRKQLVRGQMKRCVSVKESSNIDELSNNISGECEPNVTAFVPEYSLRILQTIRWTSQLEIWEYKLKKPQ